MHSFSLSLHWAAMSGHRGKAASVSQEGVLPRNWVGRTLMLDFLVFRATRRWIFVIEATLCTVLCSRSLSRRAHYFLYELQLYLPISKTFLRLCLVMSVSEIKQTLLTLSLNTRKLLLVPVFSNDTEILDEYSYFGYCILPVDEWSQ